jgi:hypothetical protein
VDAELAIQAGPQLVVPVLNARYALNAANARWGSLYDALYGTDVISEDDGAGKRSASGKPYNPKRGKKVIAYARHVLDRTVPLRGGSHLQALSYSVRAGRLVVRLKDGSTSGLQDKAQFVGFQGTASRPTSVLLQHNGLHLDLVIDHESPIGKKDPAGVSDLVLESALSTILDLEDSVAAVDAEDDGGVVDGAVGAVVGEGDVDAEDGDLGAGDLIEGAGGGEGDEGQGSDNEQRVVHKNSGLPFTIQTLCHPTACTADSVTARRRRQQRWRQRCGAGDLKKLTQRCRRVGFCGSTAHDHPAQCLCFSRCPGC